MKALGTISQEPFGFLTPKLPLRRFVNETIGVHGQFWLEGKHLHILTVNTTNPGTGQFRKFVDLCKEQYASITVHEIMNQDLIGILSKYNFSPVMRWDRDVHE